MIFLSHSWKNKPIARQLVEALAMEQIPCWIDEQQLRIGTNIRPSLISAITYSEIYLYLVSDAANKSKSCQDELEHALSLELEERIIVVPVRIADSQASLPPHLAGRFCASLNTNDGGGAARLAYELSNFKGYDRLPHSCRLSVTVRLEKHCITHTLEQARKWSKKDNDIETSFFLLSSDYEAMDSNYWSVSEVQLPIVHAKSEEQAHIASFIKGIHQQSRRLIKETRLICARFINTDLSVSKHHYYDAGHERMLRMIMHRLMWNVKYLTYIRDEKTCVQEFFNKQNLPTTFNGHCCQFACDGKLVASTQVPKHGHPFSRDMDSSLFGWGMTNPFVDMSEHEVGVVIGESIARQFMAGNKDTTELPPPASLSYGLA